MISPAQDSEPFPTSDSLPRYVIENSLDSVVRQYCVLKYTSNYLQELPLRFSCPQEAREVLENIDKLRTEYEQMKVESLSRLQELIDKLQWIDNKLLEVDIHVGKVFHVIKKSLLTVPPPAVVKKEKKVIVKGGV